MHYHRYLLVISCFFLVISLTDAVLIKEKIKASSFITTLERFGMNSGGQVTVLGNHLDASPNSAYIFICTYKQHLDLNSDARSREKICKANTDKIPTECFAASLNKTSQMFDITEKNIYDFLVINCNRNTQGVFEPVFVDVEISALNPGQSHLPYGYASLPNGFLFLTVCYSLIFCAWGILLLKFRARINSLHKIFFGLLSMKMIIVIASFVYWKIYQSTGKKFIPLFYTRGLFYTIAETLLIFLLLLISKGWKIIRSSLEPQEFRFIPLPLLFLFLSLTFFSIYNDGYYMMAMIILYFLVMPKLFFNISELVAALKIQLLIVQAFRLGNAPQRALKEYIIFYKVVRISALFYVVATLLASGTRIFIAWQFEWISTLSGEIISLIMVALISYFISPHHFDLLEWTERLFNEDIDELISNPNFLTMMRNRPEPVYFDTNSAVVVQWPDKTLSLCTKEMRDRKSVV